MLHSKSQCCAYAVGIVFGGYSGLAWFEVAPPRSSSTVFSIFTKQKSADTKQQFATIGGDEFQRHVCVHEARSEMNFSSAYWHSHSFPNLMTWSRLCIFACAHLSAHTSDSLRSHHQKSLNLLRNHSSRQRIALRDSVVDI